MHNCMILLKRSRSRVPSSVLAADGSRVKLGQRRFDRGRDRRCGIPHDVRKHRPIELHVPRPEQSSFQDANLRAKAWRTLALDPLRYRSVAEISAPVLKSGVDCRFVPDQYDRLQTSELGGPRAPSKPAIPRYPEEDARCCPAQQPYQSTKQDKAHQHSRRHDAPGVTMAILLLKAWIDAFPRLCRRGHGDRGCGKR
jgi:hypothetical protein